MASLLCVTEVAQVTLLTCPLSVNPREGWDSAPPVLGVYPWIPSHSPFPLPEPWILGI